MKTLKKLSRSMFWRNILLHFSRDNPKHTEKYYHSFIELIGVDTWKRLDPFYKNSWLAARNSFDKMYGLVAAWKNIESFEEHSLKEPFDSKNEESKLSCAIADLTEKINSELKKCLLDDTTEANKSVANEYSKFIQDQLSKLDFEHSLKELSKQNKNDAEHIKKMKQQLCSLISFYQMMVIKNNCNDFVQKCRFNKAKNAEEIQNDKQCKNGKL